MARSRTATFKIEGLKAVDQAMGTIAKAATRKNVGKRALTKAAQPIDDGWRGRVRVDKGDLRESGGVSTKLSRRQRRMHKKESPVEVFIGPGPNPQAITEEFGTIDQAPHPSLRPAWDEHKRDLPAAIGEELWIDILKTAQREAKRTARLAKRG